MWQIFVLGYQVNTLNNYEYPEHTVYIQPRTVEQKIIAMFPEEPNTMLAVFKCESGLNQDAVSHTRDFGVAQVNEKSWDNVAQEMGLDYKNSEDDNLTLARHIYNVSGKRAWVCWTKYISPEVALYTH